MLHEETKQLVFSQSIAEKYKEISEVINADMAPKQEVRKKSIREIMQESFFHGANWVGCTNFIA